MPTWSPAGSKTGSPDRRAAKTREGEVLTSAQVSRWRMGGPCDWTYDIVDVFTDRPFAGNQLAVVHGADDLSTGAVPGARRGSSASPSRRSRRRRSTRGREYATRIFTPEQEIPFAGHPTLGTAWVLRSRGLLTEDDVHAGVRRRAGRGALRRATGSSSPPPRATWPARCRPTWSATLLRPLGLSLSDLAGEAWVAGCGLTLRARPGERGGGGARASASGRRVRRRWPSGSPAWRRGRGPAGRA